MKFAAISLTVIVLCWGGRASAAGSGDVTPVPAAFEEWVELVAAREQSILRLTSGNTATSGECSVVVLNAAAGVVLTAAHCVPVDLEKFSMVIGDRDASVQKINRRLDLAVLKTRLRKEAINVALAPSMPRAGSAVAVLGFPFGARSLTVQRGIVANPDVDGWAWINADLLPGDSGGAIIDTQGRLVGVVSGFRYQGAAHIGLASPLETIRAFVEEFLP